MEYVTYTPVESMKLETPKFTYSLSNNFRLDDSNYYSDIYDNLYEEPQNNIKIQDDKKKDTNVKSNTQLQSLGNFNIKNAVETLRKNSKINLNTGKPKSETQYTHWCAKAVRKAMEAGGLNTSGRPNYGGQYDTFLLRSGWEKLPPGSTPQAGDIAVTKPHGIHKGGHVAMYDGQSWYSDAKQKSMYVYNSANDTNTFIFRYKG